MTGPRQRAEDLLIHYFRTAFIAAGTTWDSDNDTEIRLIVDALMGAAENVADCTMSAHMENAPHIYADGSTS